MVYLSFQVMKDKPSCRWHKPTLRQDPAACECPERHLSKHIIYEIIPNDIYLEYTDR